MKIVAFDVKSSIAHFRRPDTTATHLTYPFIPPTAAKGLIGAILGIEDFTTNDKVGIQLLSPVQMVSQQLSMIGKPGGTVFNRPTTIQLLIHPSYRIYYAGEEFVDELEQRLKRSQSIYPTYLGSAFALTKPVYYKTFTGKDVKGKEYLSTRGVIPASLIKELDFQPGYYVQRAGGFFKHYLGNRTFGDTVDFIYEENQKRMRFLPDFTKINQETQVADIGGEVVCLI